LEAAISKEGHGRLMLRRILKTDLVRMAGSWADCYCFYHGFQS